MPTVYRHPHTRHASGRRGDSRSFVAAARRGDQKTFDALIDHERMARSLQDNLDSHTGHGAFGQPPDANCGEYRPVGKRVVLNPQ